MSECGRRRSVVVVRQRGGSGTTSQSDIRRGSDLGAQMTWVSSVSVLKSHTDIYCTQCVLH